MHGETLHGFNGWMLDTWHPCTSVQGRSGRWHWLLAITCSIVVICRTPAANPQRLLQKLLLLLVLLPLMRLLPCCNTNAAAAAASGAAGAVTQQLLLSATQSRRRQKQHLQRYSRGGNINGK